MKNRPNKFSGSVIQTVLTAKEESNQEHLTADDLNEFLVPEEDFKSEKAARLLGKYGSVSVAATSADFAMFYVAMTLSGAAPVLATIIGRTVGSVISFLLHRTWVFRYSKKRNGNMLKVKYIMGIFIGMGLNATGVWFLNGALGLDPWPSRILTATTVWFSGFLFNKKIVFG